jgi:hypothetical protein
MGVAAPSVPSIRRAREIGRPFGFLYGLQLPHFRRPKVPKAIKAKPRKNMLVVSDTTATEAPPDTPNARAGIPRISTPASIAQQILNSI